jgi:hypothetical protein
MLARKLGVLLGNGRISNFCKQMKTNRTGFLYKVNCGEHETKSEKRTWKT